VGKQTLTPGSIADDISRAAASGDFSRTFSLQGITFDGAGNIAESARSRIQELGNVMSANTSLKLKITGYGMTDEEGLNRANVIKSALTSVGVSGNRVATTGQTGTSAPTVSVSKD
jgi:hypothetical protein